MKSKTLGYFLLIFGAIILIVELKIVLETKYGMPTNSNAYGGLAGHVLGVLVICAIGFFMIRSGRKMIR